MKLKGSKLIVLVCLGVAVSMIGIMYLFSGGELTSFSRADTTQFRWMLGCFLGSVTALWVVFAYKHAKREEILLKGWKLPKGFKKKIIWSDKKIDIRYRHAFMYGALFYVFVLIFGLGGGALSVIGHYVATILAAVTTFLIVVRSHTGMSRLLYAVSLFIASAVWLFGFLGLVFTVYFGEFLFVIPSIVWVLSELKNIE